MTYLPCLYSEIIRYLKEFDKTIILEDLWFSTSNGQPVEWDLPIGLLYDRDVKIGIWELTAHQQEYPNSIIKYQGENPMFDLYLAMLKEGDFLRNATVMKTMSLPANDQTKLWQSIVSGNHDNFWEVMDTIVEGDIKLFPIRIYHQNRLIRKKFHQVGMLLWLTVETIEELFNDQELQNFRAIVHGIEMDPKTPLYWLCQSFCYQDSFVHITTR